jgi:hypothetical protein
MLLRINWEMKKPYRAFLLRLWQGGDADAQRWLASLEDPQTREVTRFTSLDNLYRFIDLMAVPGFEVVEIEPKKGQNDEV